MRFAQLVRPKRGPDDLILVEELHRRVLEIASFYRTLLLVDGDWGFERIVTGGGGIKALFTGDSGTGKTLAAEVIAGQLGLSLVKIDLGSLVSKWVGETEKNLQVVFREAEDSHAVLFFDEADALFGKRGEIQSGTDRYANLEVGYLLQRLEDYAGLVILATNLKNEMDEAFVRRFQIVLHFPRPTESERRRLWRVAFPHSAPLDPEVDLDALKGLDITGASIVGAARMAALIAAHERSSLIRIEHVRAGVVRQFQQEARLLDSNQLSELGSTNTRAFRSASPG
jgi:SpoVK/Ycf46/Vps4 family AAA+-type ATPase